ncbi:e2a36af8-6c4e-49d9-8e9c-255dc42cd923 [Sclerotinia trifoliorum]|uniref:E2a36af8-6c4e-49d9-8e9c-255dc42cd923 n=1 Tax=Sclerotinia trifoliorum TaxID=28548 RepID=A0A8H2ZUZ1_9HELO|nr:e2a36af8-6c4e-49d9-8e9c-255dc42cd923 [Sclerotinia trifoliorum]
MSTHQRNIASRQVRPPPRKNGTNASYTSNPLPNYREPSQQKNKNPFQYAHDPQPSADEFNRAQVNPWSQTSALSPPSPQLSIISMDGRKPMHETPNHAKDMYYTKFQPAPRKPSGLGWSVCQGAVPSNNTAIKNVKDIPDPREKNEKHNKDGGCGCSIQ